MTMRQTLVPWLLAISSLPEVLGRDNSSWPATSRENVLIQHTPKTGGTPFRTIILREAARHGQTVPTHYAGDSHEPVPRFDAAHELPEASRLCGFCEAEDSTEWASLHNAPAGWTRPNESLAWALPQFSLHAPDQYESEYKKFRALCGSVVPWSEPVNVSEHSVRYMRAFYPSGKTANQVDKFNVLGWPPGSGVVQVSVFRPTTLHG